MPLDEWNFSINQTCEKFTEILGKIEVFNIQVKIDMSWAVNGEFFIMCNYISTVLLT
jgi:hypothetical protein